DFSNRLRCTDVAAEVAFLAMDLDHYGRADLREAFVAAYEAASGDHELRALLPFYQSYRATVRGLVASIAADEGSFDAAGRAAQTDATSAALCDAARGWLARGVSVALDASFRRAEHRAAAVALAESLGVPWLAVECACAPATARTRLAARAHDPGAVSDADWA